MNKSVWIVLVVLILLTGCGSDGGGGTYVYTGYELIGTWRGTLSNSTTSSNWQITIDPGWNATIAGMSNVNATASMDIITGDVTIHYLSSDGYYHGSLYFHMLPSKTQMNVYRYQQVSPQSIDETWTGTLTKG